MSTRARTLARLGLGLLLGLATSGTMAAANLGEVAKATAADAADDDNLGRAVALSGDGTVLLAGAPGDDCAAGLDCGAVYVFTSSGGVWSQTQKLTAPDAAAGDRFGSSVAISASGLNALAGAPGADCAAGNACGAVHSFARGAGPWIHAQKLTGSGAGVNAGFGASVALADNGFTALVGAPAEPCAAGLDCGAAYLFFRPGGTWSELQRLTPSDPGSFLAFGWSVALSADGATALAGSPILDCAKGVDCGAAWVFAGDPGGNYAEEAMLTDLLADAGDEMGRSVALADDGLTALVGSPNDDCEGVGDCGSAHLFIRNGGSWSEEARLVPAQPGDTGDGFGGAVALAGHGATALIGAPGTGCAAGPSCGAGYLFERQAAGWSERQKLTASDAAALDLLGFAAALSRDAGTAALGAPTVGCTVGDDCGAAYLFALGPVSAIEVPTLGGAGALLLALLLGAAGAAALRRRCYTGLSRGGVSAMAGKKR